MILTLAGQSQGVPHMRQYVIQIHQFFNCIYKFIKLDHWIMQFKTFYWLITIMVQFNKPIAGFQSHAIQNKSK